MLEPFRPHDTRDQRKRKIQKTNEHAERYAAAIAAGRDDVARIMREAFEAADIQISEDGRWNAVLED